jgi:hypothetical protein
MDLKLHGIIDFIEIKCNVKKKTGTLYLMIFELLPFVMACPGQGLRV